VVLDYLVTNDLVEFENFEIENLLQKEQIHKDYSKGLQMLCLKKNHSY